MNPKPAEPYIPRKGEWVHVEDWGRASVFEFQYFDGAVAVLVTPKTRREFRTTNKLLPTRKNST